MAGTNNYSSQKKLPPRDLTQATNNWGGQTDNAHSTPRGATGVIWNDAITTVFKVEKLLGEGGMGKVHLLRNINTGRQFAVKRPINLTKASRFRFLKELLIWSDLPEHPNLTCFDSFQIIDEEILIFSEYVEGGSLHKWIRNRSLYKGSEKQILARLLDIAIQFAWGLHCIHKLGLIHRDVKTANVLLSHETDGSADCVNASVADYGLAQARSNTESRKIYTAEYCSPEQAAGGRLDQATDAWSWGVSVLEIFMGKAPPAGTRAAEYLEIFLKHHAEGKRPIPAMPDGVAKLLRSCFQKKRKLRVSMKVAAEKLKRIYRNQIGIRYPRRLVELSTDTARTVRGNARRTYHGLSWDDPFEWLAKALYEKGNLPSKAEFRDRYGDMRRGKSRRAELIFDIVVADEARVIYKDLVTAGRLELSDSLAKLCAQAAHIHFTAGASSGALALYDQAITLYEQIQNRGWQAETAYALAAAYQNKANALNDLKRYKDAIISHKKAIELLERLTNIEGRFAPHLSTAYQNLAVIHTHTKDQKTAIVLYDKAIKFLEHAVNAEKRSDFANILALAYQNKAFTLALFNNHQAAVVLYDKAIKIFTQIIGGRSRHKLREHLATAYTNKASSLTSLKNYKAAQLSYLAAMEILEQAVYVENRTELSASLAILYQCTANALTSAGKDYETALGLCIRSTDILKQLVYTENRAELEDSLGLSYQNMGKALIGNKCYLLSVASYCIAINILERLVKTKNRKELSEELDLTYKNAGEAILLMKAELGAGASYNKAIGLLRGLLESKNTFKDAMDLLERGFEKA